MVLKSLERERLGSSSFRSFWADLGLRRIAAGDRGADEGAGRNLVLARGDDLLSGTQTFIHQGLAIDRLAYLDLDQFGLVVGVDRVDVEAVGRMLDRVVGDNRRVLQRLDQKPGRDRLARP